MVRDQVNQVIKQIEALGGCYSYDIYLKYLEAVKDAVIDFVDNELGNDETEEDIDDFE